MYVELEKKAKRVILPFVLKTKDFGNIRAIILL